MSRRPTAGAANPGRGGDGRRRMWSESPIPRVGARRVRMAGEAPPPAPVPGDDPIYVWNPTLQDTDPEGQWYQLMEGVEYQLPGGIPADTGVAALISGPYLGSVTVDSNWTILDAGTVGDLDYALVWTVIDSAWSTPPTGYDDKLYAPGMDPVRASVAMRWHWYDCAGMQLRIAEKATYEGASSASLLQTLSPVLGGAFNVIQMTQTSGSVYPPFAVVSGDTTYAQLVSGGSNGPFGYMGIVYGHDGVALPARAGAMGTLEVSSAATDTDWVSYSLGWGWA